MIRKVFKRSTATAALAAMIATAGAERAAADLHGVVTGVILGCAFGAINCKGQQRTQRRAAPRQRSSGISQAQRQENRDVQSALNAFGWNVGTVDGALGPKSRNGISQYQAYMGWGATGRLDDFQRQTLVDNWRKLQSGAGAAYPNMMAREGARGLLRTALNPNYPAQFGDAGPNTNMAGFGQPGTQNPGFTGGNVPGHVVTPQNNPNMVQRAPTTVVPPQGGQVVNQGTQQGGGLAPLPPIGGQMGTVASVASRCQIVDLKTEAAQGVIMANNLTDPDQALSEKFCDARSFSIAKSQGRIAGSGFSEDQLGQFCGQIESAIAPVFGDLGVGTVDGALGKVREASAQIGLADQATATGYGEICVGIGYRTDNAEMALAGALVLAGAGHAAYGELVAHHVREGFGVPAAPSAALEWYSEAVNALEQGAQPAFEPSSTLERVAVIRAAIERGGLRAGLPQLPGVVPVSAETTIVAPQ